MSITFSVAERGPETWPNVRVTSEDDLFDLSCSPISHENKGMVQSSFPLSTLQANHISPSTNGFVFAAFEAYNSHHNLVIRPDDVWCAILTQIGFFVNRNAEDVRHILVSHQGKKELVVFGAGTLKSANFGRLALRMTKEIQDNVRDPEFNDWVMPSFSTTTETDLIVASILMMGAMQKYFTYKFSLRCGIPTVTLLGNRDDWCKIAERISKLEKLGSEPAGFAALLQPVLCNIIESFDNPESDKTKKFWNRIAHYLPMGSGDPRLSGWLTAFCFWNEEGKCLYPLLSRGVTVPPEQNRSVCELDGIYYHQIKMKDIPSGFASVPVTVDDNGTIFHTKMTAGSVGIRARSSATMRDGNVGAPNTEPTGTEILDTIQPVLGWWMFEVDEPVSDAPADAGEGTSTLQDTKIVPGDPCLSPSERTNPLRRRLQEEAA